MNYEDLLNSQPYVNTLSATYFNSVAPKVVVFKLDKKETKLNPIYNEEIDGRIYLRGFQIPSVYKTNPFNWNFSDTLPTETENSLMFYFNFTSMVQTIHSLKDAACTITIKPIENGWSVLKENNHIKFYKKNETTIEDINLDNITTLSELATYLNSTNKFTCTIDDDDYTTCIPDFKEIDIKGSVLLKTFNREFKNVQDVIEQGDLIYIPTTNALYEVNSAYPTNNAMYKYITWQCNATRTFAYVEYERLKNYQYGFNIDKAPALKLAN